MLVRYKSLGAAKSVTGSRHFLEIGDFNVLLDCGLFQGLKNLRLRNWDEFPVKPDEIHAVIISHAHIDHSGYLPKLVKEGYDGPIYCTQATASLLRIMLTDSAKLQEEEANWAHKKGYSKHKQPLPLYTEKDAEAVFPHFVTLLFEQEIRLNESISLKFFNAGHILGAAIVELKIKGDEQEKKIVFSGDLGRLDDPLLYPPESIKNADILLVESTYGNRSSAVSDATDKFAQIVNSTCKEGCLLIPAFSVGRTQNILFSLKNMMETGKIEKIPVYIDSPMAISVTDLYKSYHRIQKLRVEELEEKKSVFDYAQFNYVRNQSQSVMINELKKKAIIISASGMCTGGRILHHLYHRLPNEKDAVMLVGYQAEGTRGNLLHRGEKEISIFGQLVKVNCKVEELTGLSAHADQKELMMWIDHFFESPKMTFVIHGELAASEELAKQIHENKNWHVIVPNYMETFELFNGI